MRVRGQGIKADDATFQPVTVTGLSVFNSSPSLTKLERKRIRSAVKELEVMSESMPDWAVLEPMYHRAMGRVGRLLACGHPDGEVLKARLNAVKRSHQTPLLERYKQAVTGNLTATESSLPVHLPFDQSTERSGPLPWEHCTHHPGIEPHRLSRYCLHIQY